MAERAMARRRRPPGRPAWWRWYPVWLRNARTWRKLAVPSLIGNFGEPVLYLLALGYGLGALVGKVGETTYVTFLASGIVCSSAMTTASFEALYSAYTRMAVQRTWDAMITTPLQIRDVVIGEVVWAGTKSLLPAAAILVVARLLGVLEGPLAPLALGVAFLTGMCFAAVAMVVTALARSYDFFLYYTTLVLTPTLLLSGVFFPLEQLGAGVSAIAAWLPLAHAVAIVRPLVTGGVVEHALGHLAALAAFAGLALTIAVRLVERRLVN
jgi:lipooligosaccharide transport system permease protein